MSRADFTGSVPEYYDKYLGPAWFGAFAAEIAARIPPNPPGDVLEIACGTGLVTRELRARLDPAWSIVATDISAPMLDYARANVGEAGITWRAADAMRLPFAQDFGAVVCALGLMFMPDRHAALREARRVLRPGGTALYSVWDRIEDNPAALAGARALEGLRPGDSGIVFRTPYEMHDPAMLRELFTAAGFVDVRIEKITHMIEVSARQVAIGQVRGTPRSALLRERGIDLDEAVETVTAELARVGGADPFRAPARGLVIEARAPA